MTNNTTNNDVTSTKAHRFAQAYVNLLMRFRWVIVFLCIAAVGLSIASMDRLIFENSNESFFRHDDPAIQAIDKYRETFGNDDSVAVAVRSDDVFQRDFLGRMEKLANTLEAEVPYLKRVTWLGSVEYLSGKDDAINSDPLGDPLPETPEEMARFKQIALSYPDYINTLVSSNGKTAVIVLECDTYPEDVADPRKDVTPAVYKVLQREEFADMDTALVGAPIQDYEADMLSGTETIKLGLICLLIQGILLYRFGRGIRAVLSPLMTMICSIILTIGLISLMRWSLSMMTIMLPAMLLSVCIGDCVHIIADYHRHRDMGEEHVAAMVSTIRESALPCLVTSLTTMLGFMSFLSTDIIPIRMAGVYSAIGVGLAFIMAMILTPISYLIRPEKEHRSAVVEKASALDKGLHRLMELSISHPRKVIAMFAISALLGVVTYPLLPVETNYIKDLSTDLKLRQDNDFFDEKMGGSMSLEITVDSGEDDGARNLAFLQDMEALQRYIEKNPFVTKTHSVVETVKRLHEVLHNEVPGSYRLPDEQRQVSECLFLYETSGGKNLDKELSFTSDMAHIHVQTRTMSTHDVRLFMDDIDRYIADQLNGRLVVTYTGSMAWASALSDYVMQGQITSLLSAVLAIAVMMILSVRSLKLGLISMMPNLVPILVPFFLMWITGVKVSIVLMIFSSVIIGICVDDTTHFYVNFKRRLQKSGDNIQALYGTIAAVGRPVTYTSVSLIAGFAVFGFSDVATTVQFGLLACAAFAWGWLADIMLSPAVLSLVKSKVKI